MKNRIGVKNGVQYEEQADWSELPQIIGLEYNQFLRTVLIAQGSFSEFLTAKESERYELLEKLVGSEEVYTAIAAKIKANKSITPIDNPIGALNTNPACPVIE